MKGDGLVAVVVPFMIGRRRRRRPLRFVDLMTPTASVAHSDPPAGFRAPEGP